MKRNVGFSFHHLWSQKRAAARVCVCVCLTFCVFSGPASTINIFTVLYLTSVAISPVGSYQHFLQVERVLGKESSVLYINKGAVVIFFFYAHIAPVAPKTTCKRAEMQLITNLLDQQSKNLQRYKPAPRI